MLRGGGVAKVGVKTVPAGDPPVCPGCHQGAALVVAGLEVDPVGWKVGNGGGVVPGFTSRVVCWMVTAGALTIQAGSFDAGALTRSRTEGQFLGTSAQAFSRASARRRCSAPMRLILANRAELRGLSK